MSVSTDDPGGNGNTPAENRLPLRWLVIMIGSAASAGLGGAAAGVTVGIGMEFLVEPQNAVVLGIAVGSAVAVKTFVRTMQQLHQILER
ncbi:hypothetical protein RB628_11860 [Streptomyces sp. ADMS]|uniref:hypothetical protein n=1 Tax=Streptomyces sp. ADMS TaxID=3071415 RepID=UPI00296E6C83|nr:hypothetical protein [Streptomyces sp. ADMS]MDW4906011.1 hypothetical protein [Streptomyces sp. ADMS]